MNKEGFGLILGLLILTGLIGFSFICGPSGISKRIDVVINDLDEHNIAVFTHQGTEWKCKYEEGYPTHMIKPNRLERVEFKGGIPTYLWGNTFTIARGHGFWYSVNIIEACSEGTCYSPEHNRESFIPSEPKPDWSMILLYEVGCFSALMCFIYAGRNSGDKHEM